ncbi:MAG: ABC transporter permease subunit [Anaerolineae bacterium]|jgi:ABC-2 type transport system permease protein|nr:ABC transporter permease subunit [Anaerolineae bacterium]
MNFRKVWLLVRKEWFELRGERTLLVTIVIFPLIFTLLPIGLMIGSTNWTTSNNSNSQLTLILQASNPLLRDLSVLELGQIIVGQQFALMFLILPTMLPAVIAAYSIVGEKTRRTLEPLLATPTTTTELLLGKCIAALMPALVCNGMFGIVFIMGIRATALSPMVHETILSSAWAILWLLAAPLIALTSVALTVWMSSRVNDPRTAQQLASVFILPLFVLMLGQMVGVVVLSPGLALMFVIGAAVIAGITLLIAVRFFQRETILTRWR